ncbi:hypothetical protein CO151_09195 [bacterium CG_4_9_14_3_um_filter_65_15]|nr:MAG: hypothetical protein CO151_09195 [bacterium CG_4_9_14_3_um_filter_65_15]
MRRGGCKGSGVDPRTPADEADPAVLETRSNLLCKTEYRSTVAGGAAGRWDGSGTVSGVGASRFVNSKRVLATRGTHGI